MNSKLLVKHRKALMDLALEESDPMQQAFLQDLIEKDEACRQFYQSFQDLKLGLQENKSAEAPLPAGFHTSLKRRLEEEASPTFFGQFAWLHFFNASRISAVILLFVALVWMMKFFPNQNGQQGQIVKHPSSSQNSRGSDSPLTRSQLHKALVMKSDDLDASLSTDTAPANPKASSMAFTMMDARLGTGLPEGLFDSN